MTSKILTKDDILARGAKLAMELVEVPELGGAVHVREMTGAERDSWEAETIDMSGRSPRMRLENARARLLVRTICDADGNRLFSDADIDVVGALSAAALDRLFTVAARLSRITAADLKELEGNSPAGASAGSGSGSPGSSE